MRKRWLEKTYPHIAWCGVQEGFGWSYYGALDDGRTLMMRAYSVLSGFFDDEYRTAWRWHWTDEPDKTFNLWEMPK